MEITAQKQQDQTDDSHEGQRQTAVPYVPPPPPENVQKRFKSPLMNGILVAAVILLGGFMMYNFIGHQLTQLAAQSSVRVVSPTPDIVPTDTPVPSVTVSPSPSY